MTISGRIVEVSPHCVYQGTVYEYRVVIETGNTRFGCFDPDMQVSESIIGKRRNIEIYPALPTNVEAATEDNIGVKPNERNPDGYTDHSFCGRVTSKEDGWPKSIELDIGTGTVAPKFSQDTPEHIGYQEIVSDIDIGDIVRVTASRVDLRGIGPV